MVKKMELVARNGLDCLENCSVTLLFANNYDYAHCFSESWLFRYKPDPKLLFGEMIDKGDTRIAPLASELFGFEVSDTMSPNSFEEMCAEIHRLLERDVYPIVSVDTFFCPWHALYRKLHRTHGCIVVGVDENADFICVDPIEGQVNAVLPRLELSECDHFFFTLQKGDRVPVPITNPYSFLKRGPLRFTEENCAKQIMEFARDFDQGFSFEEEFRDFEQSSFEAPIFKQLTYIGTERELYAECMQSFYEKTQNPDLAHYIWEMNELASKWNIVKGILARSYYIGFDRDVRTRVVNQMRLTAESEDALSYKLMDYLDKNNQLNFCEEG